MISIVTIEYSYNKTSKSIILIHTIIIIIMNVVLRKFLYDTTDTTTLLNYCYFIVLANISLSFFFSSSSRQIGISNRNIYK
jgi:hypothetical protein